VYVCRFRYWLRHDQGWSCIIRTHLQTFHPALRLRQIQAHTKTRTRSVLVFRFLFNRYIFQTGTPQVFQRRTFVDCWCDVFTGRMPLLTMSRKWTNQLRSAFKSSWDMVWKSRAVHFSIFNATNGMSWEQLVDKQQSNSEWYRTTMCLFSRHSAVEKYSVLDSLISQHYVGA